MNDTSCPYTHVTARERVRVIERECVQEKERERRMYVREIVRERACERGARVIEMVGACGWCLRWTSKETVTKLMLRRTATEEKNDKMSIG